MAMTSDQERKMYLDIFEATKKEVISNADGLGHHFPEYIEKKHRYMAMTEDEKVAEGKRLLEKSKSDSEHYSTSMHYDHLVSIGIIKPESGSDMMLKLAQTDEAKARAEYWKKISKESK